MLGAYLLPSASFPVPPCLLGTRIWILRAASSASSPLRTKYSSVVRISLCPANSRTSCICAPLRMASLMAVLRSEWMPMPRLPSRLGEKWCQFIFRLLGRPLPVNWLAEKLTDTIFHFFPAL